MFYLLLTIYCLLFIFTVWRNFNLGLALFFLLLPTYLIRFSIGPLPTTLLEVMLWIIFVIWIVKYWSLITDHVSHNTNHITQIVKQYKLLFIAITIFLFAATISVFTSINLRSALGEWKAFYVEPIIIFLILITTLNKEHIHNAQKILNIKYSILLKNPINAILFALILSGLTTSLLAIYQHFTGWMVPYDFWQNQNTFRVTAWYGFPNAVGLFLAPLIPLAIYLIKQNWTVIKKNKTQDTNNIPARHASQGEAGRQYLISNILYLVSCILFLTSSILAIFYAKSTGALVGLTAGILFLLLMWKKTRWLACLVGLVGIVGLMGLSPANPIKQELLFQDRSGQIRLSIWNETWQFLKDNPLAGAGLASYAEKIKPYHTTVNGEGIEIFHHPHNIFLTMYVNLGLLGLIAFILVLVWFFKSGFANFGNWKLEIGNFKPFIIASMIVIVMMGLVDTPYIRNDLAILFWLLPSLLLISNYELEKPKT